MHDRDRDCRTRRVLLGDHSQPAQIERLVGAGSASGTRLRSGVRHFPGTARTQEVDVSVTADHVETTVALLAIERAMAVFGKFKERDHAEIVQARKALTDYIFGQVAAGQTDEQKLVVAGLAHLKSLEKMAQKGGGSDLTPKVVS